MRRFLFLLIIVVYSQIGVAQQVVHFGRNIVSPPAPTSQTVKVSLTQTGNTVSITGWVNFLYDVGTLALNNTSGTSSGWTLAIDASSNGISYESPVTTGLSNPDFPNSVLANQLFGSFPSQLSIAFLLTGLTPGNTYSIETASFDDSSNSMTSNITIAGTTVGVPSNNSTVGTHTFSAVADGSGHILITLGAASSTFACLNGFIITG